LLLLVLHKRQTSAKQVAEEVFSIMIYIVFIIAVLVIASGYLSLITCTCKFVCYFIVRKIMGTW